MLVGITGPAGVGKDTVAAELAEYGFELYAFAKPIKQALAAMGLPEPATREEKESLIPGFDFSWRHAAQTLGTEWGRNWLSQDFWQRLAVINCQGFQNVIITDVRFENEAADIRKRGGLIVHVYGRATTVVGAQAKHASERGVLNLPGDYLLPNDKPGMQHLKYEVELLASYLKLRESQQ